jgi:hypothetical protein
LKALEARYEEASAQRAQMLVSTSWRVTAPLRVAAISFRKYRVRILVLITSVASKARVLFARTGVR